LYLEYDALTATNSTFTGNAAVGTGAQGGAIYNAGYGSSYTIPITLDFVTISGNAAPQGGAYFGADFSGGGSIRGSILAKNTKTLTSSAASNCTYVTSPKIASAGHNVLGTGCVPALSFGDQTTSNPKLGPLANNGGPTKTMKLLPGSPALNAGGS